MNNPLKSILIRGDCASTDIKYRLCPDYWQLQYGTWETAVGDVYFCTLKPITSNVIFEFSTNLVQGHAFSVTRRLAKENIVLSSVLLSKDKNETVLTPPVLKWFIVNNVPSDYISVFINQWPSKTIIEHDNVILTVNILLRRIA